MGITPPMELEGRAGCWLIAENPSSYDPWPVMVTASVAGERVLTVRLTTEQGHRLLDWLVAVLIEEPHGLSSVGGD